MTDSSGIYCFWFEEKPNEFYIGKAISIHTRVQNHKSGMLRGTHPNPKVQNYYNKYGMPLFEVLEVCSPEILATKETEYIKEFDSFRNGLNLTNGGEGSGFGEGVHNAKNTNEEYKEVLWLIAYTSFTLQEISELTGITRGVCKSISSGQSHQWMQSIYPKEYQLLINKKYTRDNSASSKGIEYPLVISPKGQVFNITNIHKFAEEHGLQYQNLHKVLTKKRNSHKGWKLYASSS